MLYWTSSIVKFVLQTKPYPPGHTKVNGEYGIKVWLFPNVACTNFMVHWSSTLFLKMIFTDTNAPNDVMDHKMKHQSYNRKLNAISAWFPIQIKSQFEVS